MIISINIPQPLVISIEFQALSDLVAYLQSQQNTKIDALTAEVAALTTKLQQSSGGLQAAVQKETQ